MEEIYEFLGVNSPSNQKLPSLLAVVPSSHFFLIADPAMIVCKGKFYTISPTGLNILQFSYQLTIEIHLIQKYTYVSNVCML